MKKQILLLLFPFYVGEIIAQNVIDLSTIQNVDYCKDFMPIRCVENNTDGTVVSYTFDNIFILENPIIPKTYFCKIPGFGLNSTIEEPSIPNRWDSFLIPEGMDYDIKILASEYTDIHMEMTPAHPLLSNVSYEGHTRKNVKDIKPYEGWFPKSLIKEDSLMYYRGNAILNVSLSPIQYNYYEKIVRAYKSITYKITYKDSSKANRPFVKKLKISPNDSFLNNTVINSVEGVMRSITSGTEITEDYLIISVPKYAEAVYKFAEWKKTLGFRVHVTLNDTWTPSTIRAEVSTQGGTLDNLQYVLIIGDHEDVPGEYYYTNLSVTDYRYGYLNFSQSQYPDFKRGRLPVSSLSEANVVINKIIDYEKQPVNDANFYSTGLHCAYFQDESTLWDQTEILDGRENRMFVQTSEIIRNVMLSKQYSVNRVYSALSNSNPKYWNYGPYSNGGMIPTSLQRPTFGWNGSYVDIKNYINNGTFYILHNDHGDTIKWAEPPFNLSHVAQLTNGNKLPVLFDICCLTGHFNDTTCLAEALLRKQDGGCVAVMAASGMGYSGSDDALACGMFDAIWPDANMIPAFYNKPFTYTAPPTPTYRLGQILDQGIKRMEETWGSSLITRLRRYCFGDPSMMIYTAAPTLFNNVSIIRNQNNITVYTGGVNAQIAFYNYGTQEIMTYWGTNASYNAGPENVVVCISAHNKIPYIDRPTNVYIQNDTITDGRVYQAPNIEVGAQVTTNKPYGDVNISGNVSLSGQQVILESGTNVNLGGELKINW